MAAPNNVPYLVAVVVMLGIAIAAITAIAILRPEKDNATLYALILGSTGPTTLALLAFMKSQETHLSVNSRLEQFIQSTDRSARAEGELLGRAVGREQSDQRTDKLANDKSN